jgi:hypothetical protein
MKKIILTIDYELFLGEKTGTVRESMIEPTEKLASILDSNDSKMTIFWDILHYYRLLEIEKEFPEIKQDRILIEKQILNLVRRGHNIQLHLHPHWLDARYENSKWKFTYKRFKLHRLSDESIPTDINTIMGCITISKELMENLIRKVDPDYQVNTFRAGGYLVEPFDKIMNALIKNKIIIDSSICPGVYNSNEVSPYDFRYYPTKTKYNFNLTPKMILDEGDFIEIPITSIKISTIRNIYYKLLRRIKYPSLENERKGIGVGDISSQRQKTKIRRLGSLLFSPQRSQFTTDSNYYEKFNYLYKKAPEYATMIIHPKLLNIHTFGILNDYVSSNKIRFISIQDFLTKKIFIE